MSDRIAGTIFLVLAIAYGLLATGYQTDFADPVGTEGFPIFVSIPMALLSLAIIIKPSVEVEWPGRVALIKQAAVIGVLVLYATALEPLGFPISTLLAVIFLARFLDASWLNGFGIGAFLAVLLYVIFDPLLGLPLPLGPLERFF